MMVQSDWGQGSAKARWRVVALAAFAMLTPTSSGAQETRCGWEGSQWVCREKPAAPSGMDAFFRTQKEAYDSVERVVRDRDARIAADAARAGDAESDRLAAFEMAERYSRIGQCGEAARVASVLGDQIAWDIEQRCRAQLGDPKR